MPIQLIILDFDELEVNVFQRFIEQMGGVALLQFFGKV